MPTRRHPRQRARPNLDAILAQFHQAICVVSVVQRALLETPEAAEECTALLSAVESLNAAHDALDRVTVQLGQNAAHA